MSKPALEYRTIVHDSNDPGYVNRILIGTAVTGLVRIEWVQARYGQVIPTNWSNVVMNQYLNGYYPLRYQVDDAQNMIVKAAIEGDFQWLLLYEHDVLPPPDAFIILNEYIRKAEYPVVSGLYYTRSIPSEPLVYRGRGTGTWYGWMDDPAPHIWCDGVPTGFLLVHVGVLKAMAADSEAYMIGNTEVRRVFHTPRDQWFDPETHQFNTVAGTSDLHWCTRVMEGDYLRKAGWEAHADAHPQYPFVIDKRLLCRHINMDGQQFP